MQQIAITPDVEKVALIFLRKMKRNEIRKFSMNDLEKMKNMFRTPNIKVEVKINGRITPLEANKIIKYIDQLILRYDKLRILHPSKFNREIRIFEKILSKDIVKSTLYIDNHKKKSISSMIVSAMHYNKMRAKIYPVVSRELKIKTCVYCNANYTITDRNGRAYYDLDHWKPKSYYPYLCTSFFNLQPSCPSCNRSKSDNDDKKFFQLWNDGSRKDLAVYKFHINSLSKLDYLINRDRTKLKIEIWNNKSKDKSVVNDTEEKLHLSDRYKEHLDVVEEILWKKQIYNKSFLQQLKKSKVLVHQTNVNRFIIGTYAEPINVHLRPLTKMVQDIAKEEGLI